MTVSMIFPSTFASCERRSKTNRSNARDNIHFIFFEDITNRIGSPLITSWEDACARLLYLGWFVLDVVRNESLTKFRECLFFKRAPDLARQIKIEMQIMSCNQ